MGIIHRGQALHREEYGWLLCLIVLKKEEKQRCIFFKAFRCLTIFSLEKPVPLLLNFDILSLPITPEPLVDVSKECSTWYFAIAKSEMWCEARFVFISVEREKCGCSCCNMVMLPFYWPLYQTSFHDQNQSKLCSDRICCFSWEPLACCQHCSRGGGGCRAVQLIYLPRAIFLVGKNNFFWYIFSPLTDMLDLFCHN